MTRERRLMEEIYRRYPLKRWERARSWSDGDLEHVGIAVVPRTLYEQHPDLYVAIDDHEFRIRANLMIDDRPQDGRFNSKDADAVLVFAVIQ